MDTQPPQSDCGWLLRLEPGILKADWKKRYCLVDSQSNTFKVFKDEEVAGNLLDQISLLTSSVKSLSAKPHAFEIVTPQKAFSFACKDAQDLLQWMTALQKGIKSAINGGVPSPKIAHSVSSPPAIKITPAVEPRNNANSVAAPTSPQLRGWNFTLATAPHEGWLYKKKEGEWKKYWVELRGENLYFFNDKTAADPRAPGTHRGSVPFLLTLCSVRFNSQTHARRSRVALEPNAFAVVTPNDTLELKADTSQEVISWITMFNNAAAMSRRKARLAAAQPQTDAASTSQSTSPTASGYTPVQAPTTQSASPSSPRSANSVEDQNERIQRIASLSGNKVCADCDDVDPQWASINLGIFICIECSGLHRSLGTHISKVRSIDLDVWEQSTVDFMASMGNKKFNEVWEWKADLVAEHKPSAADTRQDKDSFIRAKYVDRLFGNPAQMPPPFSPSSPRLGPGTPVSPSVLAEQDGTMSPPREIYHEGLLTKQGNKVQSWKQRWFVLSGNKLAYFHQRSEVNPIQTINMANAHVKTSPDRPNTFEVITPQRVWYFQAENSSEFFLWMELLRESQAQHQKALKSGTDAVASEANGSSAGDGGVIKEGYLIKRGGTVKSWKRRWFIVKDNKLAYYVASGEKTPKGSIALAVAHVKISPEDPKTLGCPESGAMFEIITTGRVYYIGAPTAEDRDAWIGAIKQSQQKYEALKRARLNRKA